MGLDPIARLVAELSRLPGIGEKTATRLAYTIMKWSKEEAHSLAEAIVDVKEKIGLCSTCFNLSDTDPCRICADDSRSEAMICVVEDPNDMKAIEKSQSFRGKYHVLHGVLSPLNGIGPEKLKIDELLQRVKKGGVKEMIVATNPTIEGEATALHLMEIMKPFNVRVTRIGYGVPMGGDLEYVDQMTIRSAIENRKDL